MRLMELSGALRYKWINQFRLSKTDLVLIDWRICHQVNFAIPADSVKMAEIEKINIFLTEIQK